MRFSVFLLVCVLTAPVMDAQASCWSDTKSDAVSDLRSIPHGVSRYPTALNGTRSCCYPSRPGLRC
jgi:hypothetical protein